MNDSDESVFTIHLKDDGETIVFNREILETYSVYFAVLFNFGEHVNLDDISVDAVNSVTIDEIPGWAVKTSLKHLKTACERLRGLKNHTTQSYAPEDLYSLIVVCDYFQMESVKEDMIKDLILMLDIETFLTTLKFALWWQLETITTACCEHLTINFEAFFKRSDCLRFIPADIMIKACNSEQIVCDEVFILRGIINWLEANYLSISEQTIQFIIRCIRYAWISIDHIKKILLKKTVIISNISALNTLVQDAIEYHNLSFVEQKLLADEHFCKPRLGRLNINKFNCLNETLKCYHSSMSKPININSCKALVPFNSSPIVHSPQAIRGWLNSHPFSVVRTYHSNGSETSSPTSSPIETHPIDHSIFHSSLYINESIDASNDSRDSPTPNHHTGYYPTDNIFYLISEEEEFHSPTH